MKKSVVKAKLRRCYGNAEVGIVHHVDGCRPRRPLCRFRRRGSMCGCTAYHFPHRRGGGKCSEPDGLFIAIRTAG